MRRGRPVPDAVRVDALVAATDAARAKSRVRAQAVARARALIAQGHSPFQADTMAAEDAGVQRAAVMRWRRRDDALGADAGCVTALVANGGAGRPPTAWHTPGAEAAFGKYCSDYLRLSKPGSAACYRRLEELAGKRGWTIPCERMFRLRLRRDVPPEVIVRMREGAVAALKLFPCQVRTVEGMLPLDCVSGDAKTHDVFVAMPDGRIVRIVVWYWQDVRTRKLLGWHWGESESWDLVRMAFIRMSDEHGLPRLIVIDNTFAASAKTLAAKNSRRWKCDEEDVPGIFETLRIPVIHTHVVRGDDGKNHGWGQAKPVERAFGIGNLKESIDKHPRCEGAYTGSSPADKPANYGTTAVPLETFLGVVAEGVREFNARTGRRTEIAHERSFDQIWAEEIQSVPVRTLTAEQRALLLLAVESTQVKPDGTFTLKAGKGTGLPRNRYQHGSLRALAHKKAGNRRVVVRFDPEDLHAGVHVFDPEGRYLCFAGCIAKTGFRDTRAMREHGRVRRQYRRALDQAATARGRLEDLQDTYGVEPAAAGPGAHPQVVEMVRPARAEKAARERGDREDRFARGALRQLNSN